MPTSRFERLPSTAQVALVWSARSKNLTSIELQGTAAGFTAHSIYLKVRDPGSDAGSRTSGKLKARYKGQTR